jgi:hypothetical protein
VVAKYNIAQTSRACPAVPLVDGNIGQAQRSRTNSAQSYIRSWWDHWPISQRTLDLMLRKPTQNHLVIYKIQAKSILAQHTTSGST